MVFKDRAFIPTALITKTRNHGRFNAHVNEHDLKTHQQFGL